MFRFGLSIDDSFVRIAHLILFRLKIDWYMCTTNGVLLTQLWVQQLIESLNSAFACLIYTTIVPGVCSKQCECVNRKPNMWTIVNWWAVRSISNGVNKNRHQNRMKEKWTKRQRLKQSIRIRTFRASIMFCYLLLFWFFFSPSSSSTFFTRFWKRSETFVFCTCHFVIFIAHCRLAHSFHFSICGQYRFWMARGARGYLKWKIDVRLSLNRLCCAFELHLLFVC